MESKVSNGSGPQDERITNLLVFGFLQNCSNYNFHEELELLSRELPVPAYLKEDHDDELQTDGNRCSYFLDGGARGRHVVRPPLPQIWALLSPGTSREPKSWRGPSGSVSASLGSIHCGYLCHTVVWSVPEDSGGAGPPEFPVS